MVNYAEYAEAKFSVVHLNSRVCVVLFCFVFSSKKEKCIGLKIFYVYVTN